MNTRLSRRNFLHHLVHVVGSSLLASMTGCVSGEKSVQVTAHKPDNIPATAMPKISTVTATATRTPTITATATSIPATFTPSTTPTPVNTPTSQLLRSQNLEHVNIRYSKKIEPVDIDTWRLAIGGMIDNAQELSLDDIKAFPSVSQTSRLKCVEGWSFAAKWFGFHPKALFDLVQPLPEAQWVRFFCADDYFESLEMRTLLLDRVLFAYGMNDAPLAPMHGAPLRLIVPFMYGFKGPKVIHKLVFAATEVPEDWIPVEKYGLDGTILPGRDHALDLGITGEFTTKGEISYEEGLESQDN
jgi:DMSO/TMAO reductase YedYZ molybdopterin-dependent catalytic subunit